MQPVDDTQSGAPPFGKFERKLAARYLGARKSEGGVGLIAMLSFMCIMLAIFAMITIMSIMNGFREKMIELTLGSDGHMYVGSAAANPTPEQINGLQLNIQKINGVENAFLFNQTDTFVQANGRSAPARVTGITRQNLLKIKMVSDNIIAGGLDTFGQGHNGGNEIAIGVHMANGMGLTIGDNLTIYSPVLKTTPFGSRPVYKAYVIAAVFEIGLVTADSGYIYMPLDQGALFFEEGRTPKDIQLRLFDPDKIHELKSEIREKAGEPVFVETWEDKNQSTATALRTEQIAMRFIFMIVVVIAVFPILAAMIMLVKNKGKDIAILRTIGTTSSSVLRIFLMSGAAIGLLGTFAGLVFGILFCLNIGTVQAGIEIVCQCELFPPEVYGLNELPVKIVPEEVFWVSVWGFLVSALATFFPAWTASKTDPVEALRYE
jgi:lipoprotein-releasing system permease protein